VTFLALLEMIRLKLVRVFQSGAMSPIRVYKRARPADAPKPILDPEKRHEAEVAAHEHDVAMASAARASASSADSKDE
jgi:chromatin segregation and condensation protein Rec8/ScpA/Scc1 (kleisin family)